MTQVPKAPLDARRQEIVDKAKATREANRLKKLAEGGGAIPLERMEVAGIRHDYSEDEYKNMWAAAYTSAIISCQVNHPTQSTKAAIIADKALEDFKAKFPK